MVINNLTSKETGVLRGDRVREKIVNSQRPPEYSEFLKTDARTKPPFVVRVEGACEDCGGSGYNPGSLHPMEPEECRRCHGSGKQIVVRNYLAEALRIATGNSPIVPQPEHLQAIIEHCRGLVAALMIIADIH